MGYAFGLVFGGSGNLDHLRPDAPKLSTVQHLRAGLREGHMRGKSMARGFAVAGGAYVMCECLVEQVCALLAVR